MCKCYSDGIWKLPKMIFYSFIFLLTSRDRFLLGNEDALASKIPYFARYCEMTCAIDTTSSVFLFSSIREPPR